MPDLVIDEQAPLPIDPYDHEVRRGGRVRDGEGAPHRGVVVVAAGGERDGVEQRLGRIAQENKVQFSTVHYVTEDTDIKNTSRVMIDASLAGDYAQVVKFVNALERSKTLFLVDGITLGQEGANAGGGGGGVRLSIKLETVMSTGAPTT